MRRTWAKREVNARGRQARGPRGQVWETLVSNKNPCKLRAAPRNQHLCLLVCVERVCTQTVLSERSLPVQLRVWKVTYVFHEPREPRRTGFPSPRDTRSHEEQVVVWKEEGRTKSWNLFCTFKDLEEERLEIWSYYMYQTALESSGWWFSFVISKKTLQKHITIWNLLPSPL